ncbi:MAG: hypothetical protein DRH24_02905 [Deltaproteobacteria bacterium]|nr:MAG: hypothetical protein DRH24_02905 [Deltaproteobacteria bacterium]
MLPTCLPRILEQRMYSPGFCNERVPYPAGLTDGQLDFIKPLIPPEKTGRRPLPLQMIQTLIFYKFASEIDVATS